jgi:hypothetical protein
VRPKVIASTATVRRAKGQIGSLFNRTSEVFPPPGLSVGDNFFARQRDTAITPGRRYVGICAHGTRIKSTLIRVYVSVLGAAQQLHERYGRNRVTDPFMTLVGYFNSLRDLGGMRRLAEDDVSMRLTRADERGLAKRFDPEIKELTSRLSSDQIRPLLDLLAVPFPRSPGRDAPRPIDVLLVRELEPAYNGNTARRNSTDPVAGHDRGTGSPAAGRARSACARVDRSAQRASGEPARLHHPPRAGSHRSPLLAGPGRAGVSAARGRRALWLHPHRRSRVGGAGHPGRPAGSTPPILVRAAAPGRHSLVTVAVSVTGSLRRNLVPP